MALKIQAKAKTTEIWVTGSIGDYWGESISAKQFIDEFKTVEKDSTIVVHLNSPGGDVFDGTVIYNLLRKHHGTVEIEIEGLAASIASAIAMAGDTVRISDGASFMIHNPWSFAFGSAGDFRAMADRLEMVRDTLLAVYMDKVGEKASRDEVSAWMEAETWFSASEALKYGFANEVNNAFDIAACAKFDLSRLGFKNIPKSSPCAVKNSPQGISEDREMRARLAHIKMWGMKHKLASAAKSLKQKERNEL